MHMRIVSNYNNWNATHTASRVRDVCKYAWTPRHRDHQFIPYIFRGKFRHLYRKQEFTQNDIYVIRPTYYISNMEMAEYEIKRE